MKYCGNCRIKQIFQKKIIECIFVVLCKISVNYNININKVAIDFISYLHSNEFETINDVFKHMIYIYDLININKYKKIKL